MAPLAKLFTGVNTPEDLQDPRMQYLNQIQSGFAQQGNIQDQQGNLGQILSQQAQGQGPSVAQEQLRQNTQRAAAQQAGAVGNVKGISPGLAGQQIARNQAEVQGNMAGQAALARTQETLGARGQLGQLLAQQAQGALGQTGQAIGGENAKLGLLTGVDQANANLGMNEFGAIAKGAAAAASGGATMGAPGGAPARGGGNDFNGSGNGLADVQFRAAGGIVEHLMKYLNGGMVEGKAKLPGDHPINDTVPTMLSPGEGVVPKSIMESPDAPELAAQFIAAIKKKGNSKKMADGGEVATPPEGEEAATVALEPNMSPQQRHAAIFAAQTAKNGMNVPGGDAIRQVREDLPTYGAIGLGALGTMAEPGAGTVVGGSLGYVGGEHLRQLLGGRAVSPDAKGAGIEGAKTAIEAELGGQALGAAAKGVGAVAKGAAKLSGEAWEALVNKFGTSHAADVAKTLGTTAEQTGAAIPSIEGGRTMSPEVQAKMAKVWNKEADKAAQAVKYFTEKSEWMLNPRSHPNFESMTPEMEGEVFGFTPKKDIVKGGDPISASDAEQIQRDLQAMLARQKQWVPPTNTPVVAKPVPEAGIAGDIAEITGKAAPEHIPPAIGNEIAQKDIVAARDEIEAIAKAQANYDKVRGIFEASGNTKAIDQMTKRPIVTPELLRKSKGLASTPNVLIPEPPPGGGKKMTSYTGPADLPVETNGEYPPEYARQVRAYQNSPAQKANLTPDELAEIADAQVTHRSPPMSAATGPEALFNMQNVKEGHPDWRPLSWWKRMDALANGNKASGVPSQGTPIVKLPAYGEEPLPTSGKIDFKPDSSDMARSPKGPTTRNPDRPKVGDLPSSLEADYTVPRTSGRGPRALGAPKHINLSSDPSVTMERLPELEQNSLEAADRSIKSRPKWESASDARSTYNQDIVDRFNESLMDQRMESGDLAGMTPSEVKAELKRRAATLPDKIRAGRSPGKKP